MRIFPLFVSFAAILSPMAAFAQVDPPVPPPAPEIVITIPIEGQEVPVGEEVSVVFTVDNFLFVDFKNNSEPFPGNPNAGHAHLWIDPPKGELAHDAAQKLLSTDPIALGTLERGTHTIAIELTQNDHTPFDPPALAEVRFRVGRGFFGAGSTGRGVSRVMDDLQFIVMALLAIGAIWLLWQKGAVKWLVSWASWEKKKGPKGPSAPMPPTPPSSPMG